MQSSTRTTFVVRCSILAAIACSALLAGCDRAREPSAARSPASAPASGPR